MDIAWEVSILILGVFDHQLKNLSGEIERARKEYRGEQVKDRKARKVKRSEYSDDDEEENQHKRKRRCVIVSSTH